MINRMSSKQLMDIMDEAETSMSSLKADVNAMRDDLDKRLAIMSNALEYAAQTGSEWKEYTLQQAGADDAIIVPADMEAVAGNYDSYGSCVLPASASKPANVFNLMAGTGPIYKNNANVYFDGEAKPSFNSMLMHDSVNNKKPAFIELDKPDFTLKIEVNPNDLFGSTAFNTIELLPYIPGSFDIRAMRIYTMQDYRNKSAAPTVAMNTAIPDAGVQRLLLDDSIDLYQCELDIHISFKNSAGKYPFGLKHLYFLNVNYNDESNIVVKMSRDHYIDWIGENITVHDQAGVRDTTLADEGIKLYSSYLNGILEDEIEPVSGVIQSSIARNVRDVYVEIPLRRSLSSIRFKNIKERT